MDVESPNAREIHQAQLHAAAEVLVVWVRARRTAWSDASADLTRRAEAPHAGAFPVGGGWAEFPVDEAAFDGALTPPVMTEAPAARRRLSFPRIPFRTLGRWSFRAGVAAALLAVAIGAASVGRTYWVKRAAALSMGRAILESTPPGSEVRLGGAVIGTTPMTTELTIGRHIVEFRWRGATRMLDVQVAAGGATTWRIDWNAKKMGRLIVVSEPPGAHVLIDDKARGVTPLTLDDLTIGPHVVVLKSESGSVRRTVDVTADGTAQIAESIYAGWLRVFAPFEVEIMDGTRGIQLDERSQAMLTPGPHEMRFENRALGYRESHRVEIKPGEVATLSLSPPSSKLTVTSTEPAEVLIDGEIVGQTPLADQPVSLGTHNVVVRSETGESRRFGTTVTVQPVRIEVDFSKP